MEIVKISKSEYNNFLENFNDSLFFQSVEWASFKAKTSWEMEIIGLKDNNKLKACAILLSKKIPILNKKMYYSPRGFIIDYTDFELITIFSRELKKYLNKNGAIFLKINPYVEYQKRDKDGNIIGKSNNELISLFKKLGYKHYGFYVEFDKKKDLEPRWLSVLNLNGKSMDDIINDMKQMTKRWINKSEKNFIDVYEIDESEIIEFKKLMKHTSERRKFEDRPLSYYMSMYKELKKHNMIKIMLAKIDLNKIKNQSELALKNIDENIIKIKDNPKKVNQFNDLIRQKEEQNKKILDVDSQIQKYGNNPIISGGLFIPFKDQVVFLFGASYKELMGYGAQYLIQYDMIKFSKENNYKFFNFYGIDGDFSTNSKNYGLFNFKRGFNADVVELIGEFDLVANKFYYFIYKSMFSVYKILKKIKLFIKDFRK